MKLEMLTAGPEEGWEVVDVDDTDEPAILLRRWKWVDEVDLYSHDLSQRVTYRRIAPVYKRAGSLAASWVATTPPAAVKELLDEFGYVALGAGPDAEFWKVEK